MESNLNKKSRASLNIQDINQDLQNQLDGYKKQQIQFIEKQNQHLVKIQRLEAEVEVIKEQKEKYQNIVKNNQQNNQENEEIIIDLQNKIFEQNAHMQLLRGQLEELKKKNPEKFLIEQIRNLQKDQQDQVGKLKEKIRNIQQQNLQNNSDIFNNNLRLNQELQRKNNKISELENQLEQNFDKYQNEKEQLKLKIQSIKEQNKILETLAQKSSQRDEKNQTDQKQFIENLRSDIKSQVEQIYEKKMKKQQNQYEIKIQDNQMEYLKLKQKMQQSILEQKEEIRDLQKDLIQQKMQTSLVENLSKVTSSKKYKISQQFLDLKQKSNEIFLLKYQLEALSIDFKKFSRIAQFFKRFKNLAQKKLNEFKFEIQKTQNKLNTQKIENKNLQKQKELKDQDLKQQNIEIDKLNIQIQELNMKYEASQNSNLNMQQKLEEAHQKINNIQVENQKELNEKMYHGKLKINELQEQVKILKENNDLMTENFQNDKKFYSTMKRQISHFEESCNNMPLRNQFKQTLNRFRILPD